MGLATNLGFPYLELSLLHTLQSAPAFCPPSAICASRFLKRPANSILFIGLSSHLRSQGFVFFFKKSQESILSVLKGVLWECLSGLP